MEAKKKILSEQETRKRLMDWAKILRCEEELKQIFIKWEKAIKNCKNANEKKHMAEMANVEIHKLFSFIDPLVVGGKEILPGDPKWVAENEEKENGSKIILR